jgi:hypothetical protein
MIIEIDYMLTTEQEIDNSIGKLLCPPEEFSSLLIEVEFSAYNGYAGTMWQPEELPSVELENLVITKVYNEQGNAISITPEQSKLVEEVINNDRLEDLVWDYLECQQEDVGDY